MLCLRWQYHKTTTTTTHTHLPSVTSETQSPSAINYTSKSERVVQESVQLYLRRVQRRVRESYLAAYLDGPYTLPSVQVKLQCSMGSRCCLPQSTVLSLSLMLLQMGKLFFVSLLLLLFQISALLFPAEKITTTFSRRKN